jgi:hypothetical protein
MGEKQKGLVILWGRGNRRHEALRGNTGIIVQMLCRRLAICVVEERLPGVTPGALADALREALLEEMLDHLKEKSDGRE